MPHLKLIARGKVRDLYEVSEEELLFVATVCMMALSKFQSRTIEYVEITCTPIICNAASDLC